MSIGLTTEQESLRRELREYYERLITPELAVELSQSEGVGPVARSVALQMGEDGWLGIGWPTEYGGQGRGYVDQFIFYENGLLLASSDAPGGPVTKLAELDTAPPTATTEAPGSQAPRSFRELLGLGGKPRSEG